MKKNGFIATSLIYSFFLIFVTLFLTIIADYLQNKVLLNTIEKGIKDQINNSMGIKDFEVGDMVSFDNSANKFDSTTYGSLIDGKIWIVAQCNYNSNTIVFYSYDIGYTNNCLTIQNVYNDLNYGYLNDTYLSKTLYNFNGEKFTINSNEYSKERKGINTSNINTISGEIVSCRERKELSLGDKKLKKGPVMPDGTTIFTEVLS